MTLYDRIGKEYDSTRRADPAIAHRLIELSEIRPGMKCLDIACGSGNYTIELAKTGAELTGIDQSETMIDLARKKESSVLWFTGRAESLPFPDNKFDGAICTLAVHHFSSPETVFKEVRRVISRGHFVIFTSTKEQMRNYWLNRYFPSAMKASIEKMPSFARIIDGLTGAGFSEIFRIPYFVNDELKDMFLYSGKYKPELYLDPDFRMGISTFASLAGKEEISRGCRELRDDIHSGKIGEIINSYKNDLGDYLFIDAEKTGY